MVCGGSLFKLGPGGSVPVLFALGACAACDTPQLRIFRYRPFNSIKLESMAVLKLVPSL